MKRRHGLYMRTPTSCTAGSILELIPGKFAEMSTKKGHAAEWARIKLGRLPIWDFRRYLVRYKPPILVLARLVLQVVFACSASGWPIGLRSLSPVIIAVKSRSFPYCNHLRATYTGCAQNSCRAVSPTGSGVESLASGFSSG